MINEFNFISSIEALDKDLFFGPIEEDDCFITIKENWNMANILFEAGIFPSLTQARNNGYNKPIPFGFTDFRVGKKKTRITILNIADK